MLDVSVSVCEVFSFDELVKSHKLDGTVKSSRCKACESLGMRRTNKYVGMTKDEAQRSRWTFYEAVKFLYQPLLYTPFDQLFVGILHKRLLNRHDRETGFSVFM
jgi:hypothetical protein